MSDLQSRYLGFKSRSGCWLELFSVARLVPCATGFLLIGIMHRIITIFNGGFNSKSTKILMFH